MARKRTPQLTLRQYAWIVGLSLLFIWLLFINISLLHKERIAQTTAALTQKQLVALQDREGSLQQNITQLGTERGQEAAMRETFGVAKPGEGVIVIVPAATTTATNTPNLWDKYFGWLKF